MEKIASPNQEPNELASQWEALVDLPEDAPKLDFRDEPAAPTNAPKGGLGRDFNAEIDNSSVDRVSKWLAENRPELLPDPNLPKVVQASQWQETVAQMIASNTGALLPNRRDARLADSLIDTAIESESKEIWQGVADSQKEQLDRAELEASFNTMTGLRLKDSAANFMAVQLDTHFPLNDRLSPEAHQANLEKREEFLSRTNE